MHSIHFHLWLFTFELDSDYFDGDKLDNDGAHDLYGKLFPDDQNLFTFVVLYELLIPICLVILSIMFPSCFLTLKTRTPLKSQKHSYTYTLSANWEFIIRIFEVSSKAFGSIVRLYLFQS